MKIYFAGSIRGGRDYAEFYASLIEMLRTHGTVLTEHIGDNGLTAHGESTRTDADIYERDMAWVRDADVLIAEVTKPSLGVGYEIGQAEALSKPVLCLYRPIEGARLSAMLAGNSALAVRSYGDIEEAEAHVQAFLSRVT